MQRPAAQLQQSVRQDVEPVLQNLWRDADQAAGWASRQSLRVADTHIQREVFKKLGRRALSTETQLLPKAQSP